MMNGIEAAENIIIPMYAGVFAYKALETLKTLLTYLREFRGVEPNIVMVILREFFG